MDDALSAARDAGTPAARLAMPVAHRDLRARAAVAENPSTPVEVLWEVGQRMPAALARNPLLPLLMVADPGALCSLPAETARALLGEPTTPPWLIAAAVRSPKLPVAERAKMARS